MWKKDYSAGRGLSGQMERKSGHKECPRCGLRNKPAAAQCDFCGWEFQDVSDEWISHVKVLEKINKESDAMVLDDELSKRIESTIVRSSREVEIPIKESPVSELARQREEEGARASDKEWTHAHISMTDMALENKEVRDFVETMIGEAAPVVQTARLAPVPIASSEEPKVETAVLNPVKELGERKAWEERRYFGMRPLPFSLLSVGLVIYLITLILYGSLSVGPAIGWSLAIVGALMIAIGAGYVYDERMLKKRGDEPVAGDSMTSKEDVVICPKCNEQVNDMMERCPNCGARFEVH